MAKIKNVFKSIALFVLTLLVILCLYTFVMTDILHKDYANVFGYTYFVVSTGSMSGTIEIHDIIFVKISPDVHENDIVTFKNKDGDLVTHRVVKVMDDKVITKGDINNVEDDPVEKTSIVGKVKLVVSPSFVLKSIAVFVILFIFLALINFDTLFKKYVIQDEKTEKKVSKQEKSTSIAEPLKKSFAQITTTTTKKISNMIQFTRKKASESKEKVQAVSNKKMMKKVEKELPKTMPKKEIIVEELTSEKLSENESIVEKVVPETTPKTEPVVEKKVPMTTPKIEPVVEKVVPETTPKTEPVVEKVVPETIPVTQPQTVPPTILTETIPSNMPQSVIVQVPGMVAPMSPIVIQSPIATNPPITTPIYSPVPTAIFRNEEKPYVPSGLTVQIPIEELERLERDHNSIHEEDLIEVLELDDFLDTDDYDDIDGEVESREQDLLEQITHLLKIKNNTLTITRINKKWLTKFQFVYKLIFVLLVNDQRELNDMVQHPTFEEIYNYDLERSGLYENLRNKIYTMPIYVYLWIMCFAILYNDEEFFDGVFKIMKYKIQIDREGRFRKVLRCDKAMRKELSNLASFMKKISTKYDNKKVFELDKIEKLVNLKKYANR